MKNLSCSSGKRSRRKATLPGKYFVNKRARQGSERRYAVWICTSAKVRNLAASSCIACLSLFLVALPGCVGNPPVQLTRAEKPSSGIRSDEFAAEYSDRHELMRAIQRKVKAHMVLPNVALPESTRIDVYFALSSSGEVLDPEVIHSSGVQSVDHAVVNAVRRAAPLPILSEWKALETPQRITLAAQPFRRQTGTP